MRALSPKARFRDTVDSLIEEHADRGLEPSYMRIKEGLGRPLSPEEKGIVTERLRRGVESPALTDRTRRGVYVAALSALRGSAGTDAWNDAKDRETKAWDVLRAYRAGVLQDAKGRGDEEARTAIGRAHALTDQLKFKRAQVRALDQPGRRDAVVAVDRALTASQKRGGRTRRGRRGRKTRRGRKGRKGRTRKGRKGRKTRR